MPEYLANMTTNGRVTVPSELRKYLEVTAGDKLRLVVDFDGGVRVEKVKYPTIASLAGVAGSLDEPRSWAEILEIAHDERAERYREKFLQNVEHLVKRTTINAAVHCEPFRINDVQRLES